MRRPCSSKRALGRLTSGAINLYPDRFGTPDFIEFDSMINLRPRQGNRSRSVEDPDARRAVTEVVARLIKP